MNEAERIESEFASKRDDKRSHLGLGDIRLTIGEQDEIVAALRALREENAELWEYVWAMEATNIAMDEGKRPNVARVNAAQERLKQRHARSQ